MSDDDTQELLLNGSPVNPPPGKPGFVLSPVFWLANLVVWAGLSCLSIVLLQQSVKLCLVAIAVLGAVIAFNAKAMHKVAEERHVNPEQAAVPLDPEGIHNMSAKRLMRFRYVLTPQDTVIRDSVQLTTIYAWFVTVICSVVIMLDLFTLVRFPSFPITRYHYVYRNVRGDRGKVHRVEEYLAYHASFSLWKLELLVLVALLVIIARAWINWYGKAYICTDSNVWMRLYVPPIFLALIDTDVDPHPTRDLLGVHTHDEPLGKAFGFGGIDAGTAGDTVEDDNLHATDLPQHAKLSRRLTEIMNLQKSDSDQRDLLKAILAELVNGRPPAQQG